jgi:hypothetical protein
MAIPSDVSAHLNIGISASDTSVLQDSSSRSLQMLAQNQDTHDTWQCQNMDIVDACRGTSVSDSYRGNFVVYTEPCDGDFVPGLPIYKSTDRADEPLFIYALDIYPDNWSVKELQGLVRWRIVSFKNFDDRASCRIETANIFHIEFAADGQPYNYFPTIYCFDENGDEFSGFKSSTINIRCNDDSAIPGGASGASGGDSGGGNAGVAIGIIVVLLLLGGVGYYFWKHHNNRPANDASYSRSKSKDQFNDEDDIYPVNDYDDIERPLPIDGPSQHRPTLMERLKSFATPLPPVEDDPIEEDNVEDDRFMDENYKGTPPEKSYGKVRRPRNPSNISAKTAVTHNSDDDQPDVIFYDSDEQPSSPRGGSTYEPDIFEIGEPDADEVDKRLGHVNQTVPDSDRGILEIAKRQMPTLGAIPRPPSSQCKPDPPMVRTPVPRDIETVSEEADDEVSELAPSISEKPNKKDPDMDLSQRSRFRDIRSRWSDRSRSLGREPVNAARERSSSKEREPASDHIRRGQASVGKVDSDRARSMERWNAANHADRNRSWSREKAGANDYAGNRRSESKERQGASGFADSNHKNTPRSTSKDRSNSSSHADRNRSQSKERSVTDDYAKRNRSRSNERSDSSAHAQTGRSSSKERSDADNFVQGSNPQSKEFPSTGSNAARNRPTSRERSNASGHTHGSRRSRSHERLLSSSHADNNKRRTNSSERSSAKANGVVKPSNNRSVSDHLPTSRHPSGHGRTMDFGEASGGKGRGTLDASKAGETITLNPDGSVIVSKKRTREDGAIVTTNTKYANIALARNHGVDV